MRRHFSRRDFLALAGLAASGALMQACGGAAATSTSSAPADSAPASSKPAGSTSTGALPAPSGSGAAQPASSASALTKVTVGLIAAIADGGIFIAQDKGYFKEQGITLDTKRFQTMADMVGPLGTGELDIAAGAPAAGVYNAIGRNVSARVVADKGDAPSPQWDPTALVLSKDLADSDKVKDFKDLKGLRLVVNGKANTPEVTLATALKKGGLSFKDINLQYMAYPDVVAAMANKAIDGGMVTEPFQTSIVSAGTGVKWKGNRDILGRNQQIAVTVYGNKMFSNQDLGQRWMMAYIKGARDYNDAFGPNKKGLDEVVNILVKDTIAKDLALYAKMTPAGLDPNGKLDIAAMQEDVKYYQEAGYINGQVDLSKVVDTSFQEYAVQQLGPYKG